MRSAVSRVGSVRPRQRIRTRGRPIGNEHGLSPTFFSVAPPSIVPNAAPFNSAEAESWVDRQAGAPARLELDPSTVFKRPLSRRA